MKMTTHSLLYQKERAKKDGVSSTYHHDKLTGSVVTLLYTSCLHELGKMSRTVQRVSIGPFNERFFTIEKNQL